MRRLALLFSIIALLLSIMTALLSTTPRPAQSLYLTPTPAMRVGQATVNSVEVIITARQVSVWVQGDLADGCTQLADTIQQSQGDTIQVTLLTARPVDAMCTPALVPFAELIPLEVAGLPAGEYTVTVNNVSATFTLATSGGELPGPDACPVASAGTVAYQNALDFYCMVVPDSYTVTQPQPGEVHVLMTPGEMRPGLVITAGSATQTLDEIQAMLSEQYPGVNLMVTTTTLGGQPALVIAGIDQTRQTYVIAGDRLYRLWVEPIDSAEYPDLSRRADDLWTVVTESLVFFRPGGGVTVGGVDFQTRQYDDLGLRVDVPATWDVDEQPGFYGLADPATISDEVPFTIVLAADSELSETAGDFVAMQETLNERYTVLGLPNVQFDTTMVDGQPALRVRGLSAVCQLLLIPAEGMVRVVAVSPAVCDEQGVMIDPVAAYVVASLRLLEPIAE